MKQNNKNKNLSLNKTTVANLSKDHLSKVQGGSVGEVIAGALLAIAGWAFTDGVADGKENRTK